MKITNIEPQRNKKRVNIYVDDLFSIGIDLELKYKHKLEIGMEVDDNFIQEVLKAEEQNKVINHALNLLSFRQRSEKEIYTALKRKDYEDFYIEKAIDYCRDQKYLDDRAFAKAFIRDKLNINKLGEQRIKYELIKKGVSQEIIDDVLILDVDDQYEAAFKLAEKKLPSYRNDDRNAVYRKLSGFLQRKGYSFEIVSKIMKEILKDFGD